MKNGFLLMTVLLTNAAMAAKFTDIKVLKNKNIEAFAKIASTYTKDEENFGDCSSLTRYSFSRKDTEKNINTIKQLNIADHGILAGDEDAANEVTDKSSIETVIKDFMEFKSPDASDQTVNKATAQLSKSLTTATENLKSKNVLLFEAAHSYENGSWSILDILDLKNNEILVVTLGFCGT